MWNQIFFLILAIFMIWLLYTSIKGRRGQFSRNNLVKTFWTLGWIAILLIAFIAFLVMLVRQ